MQSLQSIEYVRPNEVPTRFGLGRSFTYERIADGTFESVLIREAGARRGIRLVSAQSIRNFIVSHCSTLRK